MTRQEVLDLADRLVRPVFRDREIERIDVREDDDWSGEPSIYIDVSIAPGTITPDVDAYLRATRRLNRELLAAGEQRFPYVRLRDRSDEGPEPGEETD